MIAIDVITPWTTVEVSSAPTQLIPFTSAGPQYTSHLFALAVVGSIGAGQQVTVTLDTSETGVNPDLAAGAAIGPITLTESNLEQAFVISDDIIRQFFGVHAQVTAGGGTCSVQFRWRALREVDSVAFVPSPQVPPLVA